MATKVWVGGAISTAQVDSLTVGGSANGSTYIVTIGNKSITYTAGAADNTAAAAGLTALLAASGEPEFGEITWTSLAAVITATGPPDGTPVTITPTTGGAGSPTLVKASVTAPISPNDWATAANWSPSGVPVNADDVVLGSRTLPPIKFGLNQSGVSLTSLINESVDVGLPDRNTKGYSEYRPTALAIGVTGNTTVGTGPGKGPGRFRLNSGTVKVTLNVLGTGTPADQDTPPLLWAGTNATNAVSVVSGSVGLAILPGEVATVQSLGVGGGSGGQAPQVKGGRSLTLTTLTQEGGNVTLNAGLTTVNKSDGTLTINGAGAATTINNDGGAVVYNSTGTITTLNVAGGATADFTQDARTKTVTNCTLQKGATLLYDYRFVTFTNPWVANRCDLDAVTVRSGDHVSVTVAAGP